MSTSHLSLVVLRVRDPDAVARFYGALGIDFREERHGDGPRHFAGYVGEALIEIYPAESDDDSTRRARIGFMVPDVDRFSADLVAVGGTLVTAAKDTSWGRRAVLRDPEGHTVEITQTAKPEAGTPS